MSHVIQESPSGRAKCRGCGTAIAKGTLRFGEVARNPYADDRETTFWYHLECGALKRPEPLLEALLGTNAAVEEAERLRELTNLGIAHSRLIRMDKAHRSPNGRATCRHCRELVPKDTWRLSLVYFEDGYLNPAGYIHAACSADYFGTPEIETRLRHFSPDLSDADVSEILLLARAGQ